MDLLGFGKSPKPQDVEYSGSLWKDQVVAYVKEKIKKPTIVVGNSLGGYAALAAGADLNELNAGVILLNAAGYFSEEKTLAMPSAADYEVTLHEAWPKGISAIEVGWENSDLADFEIDVAYSWWTEKNTKPL